MIGRDFDRFAVVRLDLHFAWLGDGAESSKGGDFVALHQGADAAGEGFHDLVFAAEHGREIEADLVEDNAVFGGVVFCEKEMIARGEERFAWNAADVEAGAAEFAVFFDDSGFKSELRGTNGRDVAARAGADDDDVEFIHGLKDLGAGGDVLSTRTAPDCHPKGIEDSDD